MHDRLSPTLQLILDRAIVLSSDEQKSLVAKYHATHEIAYKKTVLSSIYRFIYGLAFQYHRKTKIDINEIFEEGLIGASDGIEKFNSNSKNTFLTYMVWHIRKGMLRYLNVEYNGLVRMPAGRVDKAIRDHKNGKPNCKMEYLTAGVNSDGELVDIFDTIEQDTFSHELVEDKLDISKARKEIDSILSNFEKDEVQIFMTHACGYMTMRECSESFQRPVSTISDIEHRIRNVIRSHFSPEVAHQLRV